MDGKCEDSGEQQPQHTVSSLTDTLFVNRSRELMDVRAASRRGRQCFKPMRGCKDETMWWIRAHKSSQQSTITVGAVGVRQYVLQ